MASLKVKAVEGRCVPIFDNNVHTLGRFIGREKNKLVEGKIEPGAIKPKGEEVADSAFYRRAIERGDLIDLEAKQSAPAKEAAK